MRNRACLLTFIPSSLAALLTTRTFTLNGVALSIVSAELVGRAITPARVYELALSIGIADFTRSAIIVGCAT